LTNTTGAAVAARLTDDQPPLAPNIEMKKEAIEYVRSKLTEADKAVKFRDESVRVWRGGTNESWRLAGCNKSKSERMATADGHARISIKCRHEVELLKFILEELSKP